MRQFIKNNGWLIFVDSAIERLSGCIRNYFLGRKLGVLKITIRSGSFMRGLSQMRIGENFDAGKGLWLEARERPVGHETSPVLVIGKNVSISFWGHIAAVDHIEIGDDVVIGSKVAIIDHNHGRYGSDEGSSPETPPRQRTLSTGRIRIGSNVWIGDGVVVTAGSDIGEGSVIGANAVVTGRIPPYCVALGIPARPVKVFSFEDQQWVPCGGNNATRSDS